MKLTESQLRKMVREELMNKRPLMTEARANQIAQEILEEGPIWDMTKSVFAGLGKGASTVANKAGEKIDGAGKKVAGAARGVATATGSAASAALAALKPVGTAITAAAKTAGGVVAATATAMSQIKDEALKNALLAAKKSMQTSLRNTLHQEIATALQSISKFEKDEKAAKAWVLTIVNDATLSLLRTST